MNSTPTCDDCPSTVEVTPIEDPWGGVHGYRCANCHEAAYDRGMEAAMEGPTYRERVAHEMDEARKLK